jgi:hypothetical protein
MKARLEEQSKKLAKLFNKRIEIVRMKQGCAIFDILDFKSGKKKG